MGRWWEIGYFTARISYPLATLIFEDRFFDSEIHFWSTFDSKLLLFHYHSLVEKRLDRVTSMLVTDVGDQMCWWQDLDVGDKSRHQHRELGTKGKGDLANNLANFELANQILVGEPNFDLANTNEFFANPNKIWRTEMRLGELHFELRE